MPITKAAILNKFGDELQKKGITDFLEFNSDVAYEGPVLDWDVAIYFKDNVFGNDEGCKNLREFIKQNSNGENIDVLLADVPYGEVVRYIYKDEVLKIIYDRSEEMLPVYTYLGEALINYFNELFIDNVV